MFIFIKRVKKLKIEYYIFSYFFLPNFIYLGKKGKVNLI